MKDTMMYRGLVLTLMAALTACSSEPSLTAAELARQHPNLPKIDVPTLLIWGPYDAEVPLEVGRQLDREMPNSDITVVLGSGHYVQEERPDPVRAAIKEFAHS